MEQVSLRAGKSRNLPIFDAVKAAAVKNQTAAIILLTVIFTVFIGLDMETPSVITAAAILSLIKKH